jgi:hypothetical protein
MSLEQALAIVTAAGFRVSKPKSKQVGRPALNAVGKPYSSIFDPQRKLKHKTSSSHLFQPYGFAMRFVGDPPPEHPESRQSHLYKRKPRAVRRQTDGLPIEPNPVE